MGVEARGIVLGRVWGQGGVVGGKMGQNYATSSPGPLVASHSRYPGPLQSLSSAIVCGSA
jgi:hypothetical protein